MTAKSDQPSPAASPRTSGLAIASLVMGILGWSFVPILGAIIAIITGHMAKAEIGKSAGALQGNGLATAGLILGYLLVVLIVVPICIILLLALLGPSIGEVFSNIIINI